MFVDDLIQVVDAIDDDLLQNNPDVAKQLFDPIWQATHYLAGSTTNNMPYEVVYGLECALNDWAPDRYVISTAVTQDQNFHFLGVSKSFFTLAETYTNVAFKHKIVQIALPAIYRHKPLFALLLYHELGHFIDDQFGLSEISEVQMSETNNLLPGLEEKPETWSDLEYEECLQNHSREYFADLFASCYLGDVMIDCLVEVAERRRLTFTHPATDERIKVIKASLENEENFVVSMLTRSLRTMKEIRQNKFKPLFQMPTIEHRFSDIRPCELQSPEEVHGVLQAGRRYLASAAEQDRAPWNEFREDQVERVINDLTEKSIRNFMIKQAWRS